MRAFSAYQTKTLRKRRLEFYSTYRILLNPRHCATPDKVLSSPKYRRPMLDPREPQCPVVTVIAANGLSMTWVAYLIEGIAFELWNIPT